MNAKYYLALIVMRRLFETRRAALCAAQPPGVKACATDCFWFFLPKDRRLDSRRTRIARLEKRKKTTGINAEEARALREVPHTS